MEVVKQVRMALWGLFLRHRIKLLNEWKESDNEDTSTMAYMLLCMMHDAQEKEDGRKTDK